MKRIINLLVALCLFFSISTISYAKENSNISVNDTDQIFVPNVIIFSSTQVSTSKDDRISLTATVDFTDADRLIYVSNVNLDTWYAQINTNTISIGTVVNMGTYAYCSIAYRYNGDLKTTLCYFLPQFGNVTSADYNY